MYFTKAMQLSDSDPGSRSVINETAEMLAFSELGFKFLETARALSIEELVRTVLV